MNRIEPYASHPFIPFDPMPPLGFPSEKPRQLPLEYKRDTLKKAKTEFALCAFQADKSGNEPGSSAPKLAKPTKNIALVWATGKKEVEQLIKKGVIPSPECFPEKMKGPFTDLSVSKKTGWSGNVESVLSPTASEDATDVKVSNFDNAENSNQNTSSGRSFSQSEILLMQTFIELMKAQQDQMEENVKISFNSTQKHQISHDTIKKEILAHFDEFIAQKKKSEVLSWINGVCCGALFTVGLASFSLSFFSAGASLPLSVTVTIASAQGALSIVSAGGQAFKGYVDYSLNLTRGEMEELKWTLKQISAKKQRSAEEMHESLEVLSRVWKESVKVFENLVITSTSMIR